jgi:hypothetical protein
MNYNSFGIGWHRGSAGRKRLDGRAVVKRAVPCQSHQSLSPQLRQSDRARTRTTREAILALGRSSPVAPSRSSNGSTAARAGDSAQLAGGIEPSAALLGISAALLPRPASRLNPCGALATREAGRNPRIPRGFSPPRLPGARLPWFCRNRQRFVDEKRDADQCPPAGGKSRRHS